MRPLRAEPPRARQAAVQFMGQEGSAALVKARYGATVRGADARFDMSYQDWQANARRIVRQNGAAQFNAVVVSDLCARCIIQPEQRVVTEQGIEWKPSTDPRLVGLFEDYRNQKQNGADLVRAQAWRYVTDGEMVISMRDGAFGVEYGVHSIQATKWGDKTDPAAPVTIQLVPNGKVEAGSAFTVPREQVAWCFYPDHEWGLFAWSPMAAAVEDFQRWRSLARYDWKYAESMLAMGGMLWMPGEAFVTPAREVEDVELASEPGEPRTSLDEDYYQAARMRLQDDGDIAAIAPWLVHWDKEFGPPEWIKIGDGLDQQSAAARKEAMEDAVRGLPVPSTTVMGGGVSAEANHWAEWLAKAKTFESAVAPFMDRICHMDLTQVLMWPRLIQSGIVSEPGQLRDHRMGYDPSPVIVQPDVSDIALRLAPWGAISYPALREACGFDESQAADDADLQQYLEFLSKGTAGGVPSVTVNAPGASSGLPAGPNNVTEQPPQTNGANPPPPPETQQASASRRPFVARTAANASTTLRQLTRLDQQLWSRVLKGWQDAYDGALRQAGVRVKQRARSRMSKTGQQTVATAVDAEAPLEPLLGAVGITELELLRASFDNFAERARADLALYRSRKEAVLAKAGLDTALPDHDAEAVDYLVATLNAATRRRLLKGTEAVLAAVTRVTVPRVRKPSTGFDLPGLPDPEELAQAAARFVRNAISISEGRAAFTMPSTPDEDPQVHVAVDTPGLTERVAAELEVEPVWQWEHGFYGEPLHPCDAHQALGDDGFTTTDREGDPGLANPDDWPEGDFYQPADHDGCTCEWVPVTSGE